MLLLSMFIIFKGRLYQFSLNGLLLENWWPQYQFEDLNVIVHSQAHDKVKYV